MRILENHEYNTQHKKEKVKVKVKAMIISTKLRDFHHTKIKNK